MDPALPTIVTYWQGPVGWLERLCLASIRQAGHRLEIFTTGTAELRALGIADDVHDVRDMIEPGSPERLYHEAGQLALFSDIIRLRLLRMGRGVWLDCDCLMLAPLVPEGPHVMGWYPNGRVGNSVLYLAPDSQLLADYYGAVTSWPILVPWATRRVRLWRQIEVLMGRKIPKNPGRMSIGPRALTYFVVKNGLKDSVLPATVFYPVAQADCLDLVDADAARTERWLRPETQIVHAWNSNLKNAGALKELPPATSYLGQAYRRLCK
jgi:hypothetical protein